MNPHHASRLASWGSGAAFLVSVIFCGMILGGLVSTRVLTTTAMGWDQLADALGGSFVGAAVALAVAAVTVARISTRRRLIGAGLALVAAAAGIAYLRSTPPKVAPPAEVAAPPVPSFTLRLGTVAPPQGQLTEADGLPWTHLRISSNLSFDFTTPAPSERCLAPGALRSEDGMAVLKRLRTLLEALPGEVACPPCPACVEVGLEWYLDQDRHTLAVSERCWRDHADLAPLRASIEGIVAGFSEDIICEPAIQ